MISQRFLLWDWYIWQSSWHEGKPSQSIEVYHADDISPSALSVGMMLKLGHRKTSTASEKYTNMIIMIKHGQIIIDICEKHKTNQRHLFFLITCQSLFSLVERRNKARHRFLLHLPSDAAGNLIAFADGEVLAGWLLLEGRYLKDT